MRPDGTKSHGKVFGDGGETMTIRHEAEDALMKYKSYFMIKENSGQISRKQQR